MKESHPEPSVPLVTRERTVQELRTAFLLRVDAVACWVGPQSQFYDDMANKSEEQEKVSRDLKDLSAKSLSLKIYLAEAPEDSLGLAAIRKVATWGINGRNFEQRLKEVEIKFQFIKTQVETLVSDLWQSK